MGDPASRVTSKLMDRAFNKAVSAQQSAEQAAEARLRVRTQLDEDADLRELTSKMDASNAVSRMLLAQRDGDFFRLLELPAPEADELGRPTWPCTPAEVSKAYRRLSMLVHPDKNPGEDARVAFEALNQAHQALRDRGQLEELLNKAADTARRRRDAAEAAATPAERVALYAVKKERARTLQQQQGGSFQAEIQRQMHERQQRAKRKRDAKPTYRRRAIDSDEEPGGGPAMHASERPVPAARSGSTDSDEDQQGVSLSKAFAKARSRPKAIF